MMAQQKQYVPLWKQWKQSKEGKDYLKNEAPKVKLRMAATLNAIEAERIEKQRIKERDEQMAKEFHLRWLESSTGKVQETKHNSEKSAKDRARDLSYEHSPVQVGEVDGGKLLQQWEFEKGKQKAMDTKKQVSVAPISKKEALKLKTNEVVEKAPKPDKSGQKKGKEKAGKAPTLAGKVKPQPLPKSSGQEPKKTGTIRDQFGLREGSNREKLVDCLLEAKGKPVPITALLKAVYGNTNEEGKTALNMVLKGIQTMINKNKIKLEIIKTKTEKGLTIALKAK